MSGEARGLICNFGGGRDILFIYLARQRLGVLWSLTVLLFHLEIRTHGLMGEGRVIPALCSTIKVPGTMSHPVSFEFKILINERFKFF